MHLTRYTICHRKPASEKIDIGLGGEVETIDPSLVAFLDSGDFIPVIAPIGVGPDGEAYNLNADVAAGKIAITLGAEKLVLLTNTTGVLDKQGNLLTDLRPADIARLQADGAVVAATMPLALSPDSPCSSSISRERCWTSRCRA